MRPLGRGLILLVITLSMVVVAASSWHSVEEIHYLKTFYPQQFTVQDVFYASGVELIKVFFIALPLFLVISVGLYGVCYFKIDRK